MDVQVIKHPGDGEAMTIYDETNVKGKVYLVIRSENGTNEANLWWIVKPYGSIRDVGVVRNDAVLAIPGGWLPPVVGSTLRCACKPERTVIYLSATEAVDKSYTFNW